MVFLPFMIFGYISVTGTILMLLTAIVWAVYALIGKGLLKKYGAFKILFYNFAFSFIIFLLMQSPIITVGQLSPKVLLYIILVSVVSTYLAYSLYLYGLKRIKVFNVEIIGRLKPLMGLALAWIILSQTLTLLQGFGGLLVFISVCLINKKKNESIKTYKTRQG